MENMSILHPEYMKPKNDTALPCGRATSKPAGRGRPTTKDGRFDNFQRLMLAFMAKLSKLSNLGLNSPQARIRRTTTRLLSLLITGLVFTNYCLAQNTLSTQPDKTETRKGNKEFQKDNYTDAEASYKKALDKKNNMPEATFNLGDAVYKQKRYDEAARQFELSAQTNPDNKIKAQAYHNLGNSYLEQKKWPEAINSYKDALKLNADDKDTKYNLAYANAMIVKEKNEQKQKPKDQKDDKKDQKKDQKDQKPQPKPDSKEDQQQSKNDKNGDQKPKPAQAKLTKQEAEKLLQALMNEEQKTNQKVEQKQMRPVNAKIQKDW
jgi:Ca-activated chloride channel family protein